MQPCGHLHCCGCRWSLLTLAARVLQLQVDNADVLDLLHLTINSMSDEIPEGVRLFVRFPQSTAQLPTAEVLDLLCTAIECDHMEALISILPRVEPLSLNRLTPEQLLPVIKRAVEVDPGPQEFPSESLCHLLELPAAQHLPAHAAAALWHSAVEVAACGNLRALCKLPAAKHISFAQLGRTVEAAAVRGDDASLQYWLRLLRSTSCRLLLQLQQWRQLCKQAAQEVWRCCQARGRLQLLLIYLYLPCCWQCALTKVRC